MIHEPTLWVPDVRHIGTGLFVGSGTALATGDAESLIIAYILIGIMPHCTTYALNWTLMGSSRRTVGDSKRVQL